MLGEVLVRIVAEVVAGAAVVLVRRIFRGDAAAASSTRHAAAPASVEAVARAARGYRDWAREKGLTRTSDHVHRGSLAGVSVTLKSGLGGSAPAAVELELALHSDVSEPVLVVSGADIPAELRPAFERLGDSLRSIGLTSSILRMRLAPLVDVAALEDAWHELDALVRSRANPSHARPFR